MFLLLSSCVKKEMEKDFLDPFILLLIDTLPCRISWCDSGYKIMSCPDGFCSLDILCFKYFLTGLHSFRLTLFSILIVHSLWSGRMAAQD